MVSSCFQHCRAGITPAGSRLQCRSRQAEPVNHVRSALHVHALQQESQPSTFVNVVQIMV